MNEYGIVDGKKIFLCLLNALVFASVPFAQAQQPKKTPRVGILRVGSPPDAFIDAFRLGLREIGYEEGKNVLIEYRWVNREDQLTQSAAELVRLQVDVLVATSTPAALAAKRTTQSIPIVVPVMADPIGSGLVISLARPRGNLTGLTSLAPELWPKRLELLKRPFPTWLE
jgi:putative ABC transport system substrate-binding protein